MKIPNRFRKDPLDGVRRAHGARYVACVFGLGKWHSGLSGVSRPICYEVSIAFIPL